MGSSGKLACLVIPILSLLSFLPGEAVAVGSERSLAGVHWYSGDSSLVDFSVPPGERGYNVEVIFDTGWCDGDVNTDPGGVRAVASTAKAHGLVNIIRVDYRQLLAVPTNPREYGSWAAGFINCTRELSDLASLFIVGNEPNIEDGGRPEGDLRPEEYAAAFNYLHSRKGEMPVSTQLLATFNSPFTPPAWMLGMSSQLTGVDGFALHTGGIRPNCTDPRLPCAYGGWSFDGAFRYYRDVVASIHTRWWDRPVYITEFNTYTGDPGSEPQSNYRADWINQAFEEIRSYNANRQGKPAVKALAWFVDRPQSWPNFALRSIAAARVDMTEEFHDPENRGGGSPSTPPGTNLARSAVGWQASSSYSPSFGGDQAYDGIVSASSKWTSDGSSATSWLALDLGRADDVTGFIVRHAGAAGELKGYNTQAFRLESAPSLSGPWTVVAAVSNPAQDDTSPVVLASPVTTRYVRLYVTDAGIDNYARIPEFEVYGTASTPPPGPGPLVNGDFESAAPGSAVGTGWASFSSGGYPAAFDVVSDQVHAGSRAQRVRSLQPTSNDKYAGIHQVVATQAGQTYTVSTWSRTHFAGGIAWDHIARLGIDLAGGSNFEAPSVQWHEFDSAKDLWHPLERRVTATGTSMTIYLQAWRKWASGGDSFTWFDDVQLIGSGPPANRPPTAVPSADPTSGAAPLAVAFSGGGSSDPDGDALSHGWSFGDGAQGSGVTTSHIYATAGTYTATLTVDDGRGGTDSATATITVSPASGNRPPRAEISADPRLATIPFTVTLDGGGSSDPDGDLLTYSWSFADGVQGSGPTMERTFVDANGDMKEAGGYLVTLTVRDGQGGTDSASVRIGVFPPGCPPSLDFDTIRAELDAQGMDLEFVKIGFHTGGGGIFGGLGKWERCLDAAGVPFTVKQVPSARNASVGEAAQLRARSGVPHTAIYRRCCGEYELPDCAAAGDWNNCTDEIAQQQARAHWLRHVQAFPPEVVDNKPSIWVETINEPWKGDSSRNNAEWLAKFSYYTALEALAAGYNYAAFGWSTGEPEYGPPPYDLSPSYQWDGPEMQNFLRLAGEYPGRIAISLHEYNLTAPTLRETYPHSIGRVQKLLERCDANGIGSPTVLITEFGWPGPPPVEELMSPDNVPWAAGLYAEIRPVKGVALWDAGDMASIISGMTTYALQNYFAIPR